ncbi:UxaA family hydrolase [Sphaerochaeta halotolerans]|jgi:altronate hydrolase|uniref:UxaA family hydrolase n=1 Tax=Sphaerochaeta halotolerans TaxID=2293840 RepID=UPI0013684946|nr:altronate dehydratase family protein [Sphaerochaeta halotolerans]MDK2859112.1 altronate hydrolase [Sphaerochaeta sp.]MDN5333599.1 altronate hydrolase [Sphaerochaeta sp.]MXI87267.1 altronate dehydratase [Sphaerochaeta halotolerans]
MEQCKFVTIHPDDVVAVAIAPLGKGEVIQVQGKDIPLAMDIPSGHKFAIKDIAEGEPVIKYGAPIGVAKQHISKGEHVHGSNIKTLLCESADYHYNKVLASQFKEKAEKRKAFWADKTPTIQAYRRANGKIGIRNELWIVPTVGCVNKIAETLVSWANKTFPTSEFYDGIHVWNHPYGCSQLGDDHEATRTILSDLVHHPNAGGVLVLALGCENNTPESFKELVGAVDSERVKFLTSQDVSDEIEESKKLLTALHKAMQRDRREPVGMDNLIVGFKCGGSDGLSGITANPLVGRFCDALTAMGGTGILTEVPEMFGAEQLLMNRCQDEKIYEQTVRLIDDFKQYFIKHEQVVYENPSPGNKAGGISTLEDKSLGCIQKGGEAIITDVLAYGQQVSRRGLNLLSGPGNDIVSTTALTATGAHIILFTTGRGTPLGAPVPTVKISSNSALAAKKPNWIDFDAGRLLAEDNEVVLSDFLSLIQAVASGEKKTRNEENGYAEISLFKDGVIL